MDINDPNCISFQFLSYVHDLTTGERGGGPAYSLGWYFGLNDNQTRDVIQYLRSLGMINLFSGSRGWNMSDILSLRVTSSTKGRRHVRTIRNTRIPEVKFPEPQTLEPYLALSKCEIEIAFLRAINAEPAEKLPKIAYADWLAEQGIPLAEGIYRMLAKQPNVVVYQSETFFTWISLSKWSEKISKHPPLNLQQNRNHRLTFPTYIEAFLNVTKRITQVFSENDSN